jgi:hypothetical protein
LTRMSGSPNGSAAAAAARATDARSERSALTHAAAPSAAADAASRAGSRAMSTARAPARDSADAIASPMPELPPVTTAVRPSSENNELRYSLTADNAIGEGAMTITEAYLNAALAAADLIGGPLIAAHWGEPSALAEFSVGGLTVHMARQITNVPSVLKQNTGTPISVLDHYASVAWVGAPLDAQINVTIRADAEAEAADGPAALAARTRDALLQLSAMLPGMDPDTPAFLPWTGWSLTADGFLTTRLLEIVIHADDLAASVGLPAATMPAEATDIVLVLLTRLAARRHGSAAVLRAFSRRERAPESIVAF